MLSIYQNIATLVIVNQVSNEALLEEHHIKRAINLIQNDSTEILSEKESEEEPKQSNFTQVTNLLKFISFSQYPTILYYKKNATYASSISGLLSIIAVIGIAVFAVLIFKGVIKREEYTTLYEEIEIS